MEISDLLHKLYQKGMILFLPPFIRPVLFLFCFFGLLHFRFLCCNLLPFIHWYLWGF